MQENNQKSIRETKLIHVKVIDGIGGDVKLISDAFKKLNESLPFDLQAIVTNDVIDLHSVDYLIDNLKELKEKDVKNNDNEKVPGV